MLIYKLKEPYINSEQYLDLTGMCNSLSSSNLIQELSNLVVKEVGGIKSPSKRLKGATGALTADLLACAAENPLAFRYRSVGCNSFADEPIGYRAFRDAFDALVANGFIESFPGKKGGEGGFGTATRMRATGKLIALALRFGIALDRLGEHFGTAPLPATIKEPVVMRAPSRTDAKGRHRGAKLKLDTSHPDIVSSGARINRLNTFMAGVAVTGIKRWTLQRVYCDNGKPERYGRFGGRIYSPFQNGKKKGRRHIRFNGELVVEVDIGASFLTIYHSLMHRPLDTSVADLYAMAWPPRAIAKAYINAAFGLGKVHSRWPSEVVDQLENPQGRDVQPIPDVRKNYPVGRVRTAVTNKFPLLADLGDSGCAWGDLHYAESEVVLATIESLAFEHAIPSLPLHDAILVPVSKSGLAMRVLSAEFERHIGVKPKLKLKEYGEIRRLAA